jgi:hypothetical protein
MICNNKQQIDLLGNISSSVVLCHQLCWPLAQKSRVSGYGVWSRDRFCRSRSRDKPDICIGSCGESKTEQEWSHAEPQKSNVFAPNNWLRFAAITGCSMCNLYFCHKSNTTTNEQACFTQDSSKLKPGIVSFVSIPSAATLI